MHESEELTDLLADPAQRVTFGFDTLDVRAAVRGPVPKMCWH